MSQQLHFKISSALKNIIGRDLIKDDFIAVFELVKNSYDAHASQVDIYFENIYSENAKIVIKDNGKGMSYDDLLNKWLFVAYSAKKEGTEEDSFDYRDRIAIKRAYAGAKGIGRFSCDRLGSLLYLETKKDAPNSKVESLLTDWNKFESDLKDEFIDVSVLHDTISNPTNEYEYGTTLEISNLHNSWDRHKILKLKDALAKLINPNSRREEDHFKITLHVEDEIENDKSQKQYSKKVNGEIQNLIFETLDWKTTKIVSEVQKERIVTSLFEGGKLIYTIEEHNNYRDLSDIQYAIYFLNRSAKVTFSKNMGIQPVEYGHILMYKNGLRIYPYGERGEDPLKMDNRKAQGQRRFLGTREVIGYIDISGENSELRETSSRGDGLVLTNAYNELKSWFLITLRRLEKYGIDIIDWGNIISNEDYINLNQVVIKDGGTEKEKKIDINQNLRELIHRLTSSSNIISYDLAPEIWEILESKQSNSPSGILKDVKESLNSENFNKTDVLEKLNRVDKDITTLKKIKDEAEQEAFENLLKNAELERDIDIEKQQSKYLLATRNVSNEVMDIVHSIKISAQDMSSSITSIFELLSTDKFDKKLLIRDLEFLKFNIDRSKLLSEFVLKADLKNLKEKTWIDVPQYISEYIQIYNSGLVSKFHIKCINSSLKFRSQISILDISIILENLISNSRKAGANEMEISFSLDHENFLLINISDNGEGLSKEYIDNPESIFKLGITNKNGGSGIGLHTLRELIIENLHGNIHYSGKGIENIGSTFTIILR